jgi:hypothetical protein
MNFIKKIKKNMYTSNMCKGLFTKVPKTEITDEIKSASEKLDMLIENIKENHSSVYDNLANAWIEFYEKHDQNIFEAEVDEICLKKFIVDEDIKNYVVPILKNGILVGILTLPMPYYYMSKCL